MTVVACKITEAEIVISADSQTTWGGNKLPTYQKNNSNIKVDGKLFEINGVIIGCAGSCAHVGMLHMFCRKQLPVEMVKDRIFDWLSEFKEWCNKEAQVKYEDLCIGGIIVKDGKAFWFTDYMEVNEITDYFAYGSGMFLALGAMELGASSEKAVEVAIKYDLYCGGDVITKRVNK